MCELRWIDYILKNLCITEPIPIDLWCDNQAALQLHIVANPVFHEQMEIMKHIEMDRYLTRDQYKKGFVHPQFVASNFSVGRCSYKASRLS